MIPAIVMPCEHETEVGARPADQACSMVPYGPEHPDYPNAPSDWDGGPYLCRDGQLYHMRGYGWEHGLCCWNATANWDRVAYTSRDSDASLAEDALAAEPRSGGSADPKGIAQ